MAVSAIHAECIVIVGERAKYKGRRTAYDQKLGSRGRLFTPTTYGAPNRTVFTPSTTALVAIDSPTECMSDFDQRLMGVWKKAPDLGSHKNGKAGAVCMTGKKKVARAGHFFS